jgi:gamma-glutamyltranspeptidase
MALVHDGDAHAVNGSGRAPMGLRPGPVPLRGVGSITVPGAVHAWETLAERWGSQPLARALEGAATLAHKGVAVAPSLARTLADCRELVAADAGMSAVFAPDGALLQEGDVLVQERLGLTLERLAERGGDDLYAGETGATLVAGLQAVGARLARSDLESHRTEVSPALRRTVGGEELLTMGPNSQGFSLIQIMAMADHLGLRDPFGAGAPTLAAIFRESARDRDRHLADPAAMERPIEDLLSVAHIAELTALAGTAAGLTLNRSVGTQAKGDTIALVAADGSGLAVSLIQSIFYGFGSGVLEPRTGILCHNRGACFSADPESPNAPAPGKRPLHTLMPLVVEREGRVRWVAGTMGGHAQPQIHAQLLLRRSAGADAQEAVSAARFIVGDTEPGAAIAVEEGFDSAWEAFTEQGATPVAIPPGTGLAGHAHAIAVRADGSFDAGSDPRADGAAVTSS